VGHGASIPLAGTAGLLRFFVTGSPELRVKRVMEASGKGEEEAWKEMEESDNQRRDYLRRFYDVPEESPALYDVVINTDQLSREQAVELIVRAAQG
jgi:cytidylate kinase